MRKTKIICTMGPAIEKEGILEKLIESGMDCARFNFSHGDHEEQKPRIENVKRLRKELNKNVALLLDTKGPELRLRDFKDGSIILEQGQEFTLLAENTLGDINQVAINYGELAATLEIGTKILIDDGKIAMDVIRIEGKNVVCKIINGGKISNRKSVNIPNASIPMPYICGKDHSDILFGIENDVDYIAASFVRNAADVNQLRKLLDDNGGEHIKIISKIENIEGIKNVDEIIDLSDGIMVARGDLGVEIAFSELPAIQKTLIEKCYLKGKQVVTATQMLESMTNSPRPTRAEVSDVANAIYDGTTVIMLSGETAAGDYPVEAVRTMAEIALAAEETIDYKAFFNQSQLKLSNSYADAIAKAACNAAHNLDAKAIVTVTRSGATAELLACYRPNCPIIAVVVDEKSKMQINLEFGVVPIQAEEQEFSEQLFHYAVEKAMETGLVSKGDTVVIVSGSSIASGSQADLMKIHCI